MSPPRTQLVQRADTSHARTTKTITARGQGRKTGPGNARQRARRANCKALSRRCSALKHRGCGSDTRGALARRVLAKAGRRWLHARRKRSSPRMGYALGARLGPESYVHIPSWLEHDIDVSTTGGCTILYLYLGPTG